MEKTNSTRTFFLLIAVYALIAGISVFLPQDASGLTISNTKLPASVPVIVLVSVLAALVIYGGLGYLGLILSRKLELPEMWDATISNRQRFLVPALVGFGCAIVIIIGDQIFAPINGIGHFPHPPFPTSITASIAAGIGEEIMFRLFFTSFWTWLIARIILRGRWQTQVYWVISVIAAIAFGMGHLPSIMFLYNWTSISQVPSTLLAEMILLNGVLSIFAAYYFKKYGFLAPVGIHFWADILWHVIWGLI
jgi:hypothetical protein